MRSQFATSSLLSLLGAIECALAASLSDVPTVNNFIRRNGVSATVIGDYVYFDGGEIAQLVDGGLQKDAGFYVSSPVNSTISIDISKSWTNSDVVLNTIARPWVSKSNQVIWTDNEEGTFYVWSGKWIMGANMTTNEFWKFTTDGNGSGSWSLEEPANPALFNDLEQYEHSAYVSTANTGYSIGGLASGWTRKYRGSNQVVPGMVTFNMETKIWQNGTTAFSPFDTLVAGAAHYVPTFGINGLVMVFGGLAMTITEVADNAGWANSPPYNFRNLTFFDPETKESYWQIASGTIPPSPRTQHCLAGFKNDDGGYEILLFGGYNHRDRFVYNDAYILSLPGFVWTKVPQTTAGGRRYHACVAVGNRQVLTIGGTRTGWEDPDPAPQGLLLFDMTDLEWKNSFDANAATYERARDIKNWYNNGSLDTVEWSSPTVQRLFVVANSTTDSGSSSSPEDDSPDTGDSPSSTPAGVIAGGVVGGIAGLALIVVAAWLFMRRRRRGDRVPTSSDDGHQHGEVAQLGSRSETSSPGYMFKPHYSPVELNTQRSHAELSGTMSYTNTLLTPTGPVHMDHVQPTPVELDASTIRY